MVSNRISLQNLITLCNGMSLEPDLLLAKAKSLLKLYRGVASVTRDKTSMTIKEAGTLYSGNGTFLEDIKVGLSYLADFEPEYKKRDFEAKVSILFETHWMIELMNTAIERVRGHLDNGNRYYYILYKSYFDKQKYLNDDLQDLLDIAPSTFFKFKREATLLFGIYLWGYGIPELSVSLSNTNDLKSDKKSE